MKSGKQIKEKLRMKQNNRNLNPPTIAPGILPGVQPDDLKAVSCKACGEPQERFIAISVLRHASRFQTQHGQPMLVNFNNGFACLKCGAVNEFTIEGLEPPDVDEEGPESDKIN
jgi:hypothetical protein